MQRLDHTNLDYKECETQSQMVQQLIAFVASDLKKPMEEFFIVNCRHVNLQDSEHSHKYFSVYQEYTRMLEGELEHFVAEQGLTTNEFFRKLQAADQVDPEASQVIQYMLGATDYARFVDLLCDRQQFYFGPDAQGVIPDRLIEEVEAGSRYHGK